MVTMMGFTFNLYGAMLLIFFLFFMAALWRAQRRGQLDWTDMITRDGTKVSTTKILQLVGGIVGTWIMVQMTLQEKLTWDLFAIYLGYVASIDGFAKLVMAKYGAGSSDDSHVPYPRRGRNRFNNFDDEDDSSIARRTSGGAKTPDLDE